MRRATIIVPALAVLALAACSSSPPASSAPAASPSAPPATTAQATAASPVTILKQAGATPDPGTVYGSHDLNGDRYASGTYPGGESITVYTSYNQSDYTSEQARPPVDDSHGEVTIPSELAVIAVDAGGQPTGWGGPTPTQIAVRVHGLVIQPH